MSRPVIASEIAVRFGYQPNEQKIKCEVSSRRLIAQILIAFSLFTVVVLQSITFDVHAADQQVYEASYKVSYDGIDLGSSRRTVALTESQVAVSKHELAPEGLAVLLGVVEYTDTTKIAISSDRIQPITTKRSSGKASDSYAADFNWNDRVIKFSTGSELEMPDHSVHDLESWLMLLMVAPAKLQVGSKLSILERADRLRTYEINRIDNDAIDFQGQSIDTVRFRLRDMNNQSRSYTVWMAPGLHNLVVQLTKHKKSSELTFSIANFRDLTSAAN